MTRISTFKETGQEKFENDHGGLYELADDDHAQYALISSGSGAPGSAPTKVGAIYVDTTNKISYVAKGTGSSADWVEAAALAMTTAQRDAVSSPMTGLQTFSADTYVLDGYDSQRWRGLSPIGWSPIAYPVNFQADAAFTTAVNLAAEETIVIPIRLVTHMLLRAVSVRNTDTTGTRTFEWRIYAQSLENSAILTGILNAGGSGGGSVSAASTMTAILDNPHINYVYIPPAMYWLAIRNLQAINTFGLGSTAASSAFAPNSAQRKVLSSVLPASLDFSSGWTSATAIYAVCLHGCVFGQSAIF